MVVGAPPGRSQGGGQEADSSRTSVPREFTWKGHRRSKALTTGTVGVAFWSAGGGTFEPVGREILIK